MRKKVVKVSLLVIALMISITIPILAVTAKKKEWNTGPIYIDDTIEGVTWADLAAENHPWLKGKGTEEDPYMIKNVVINAGDIYFCMLIMNSEAYFKIMDCTFSNTGPYGSPDGRNAALILVNTTNGVIFKNEMFDCGFSGTGLGGGIALVASSNNRVQKNFCHDNELSGIYVQYSNDNIIRQNLCTGNTYGIFLMDWSNNNEVTKNECYDNEDHGILLISGSNDNLLTKNECKRNLIGGITVSEAHGNVLTDNQCDDNSQGIILANGATYNEVTNNDCYNNAYAGILITNNANDNLLMENDCSENWHGIQIIYAHGNDVIDNVCYENFGEQGILIMTYASDNTISGNKCFKNQRSGIVLYDMAYNNIIADNICYENLESGIVIDSSFQNTVENNLAYENGYTGMQIYNAEYNRVGWNTFSENYIGLHVISDDAHWMNSNYNEITNNVCNENSDSGITLSTSNGNVLSFNNCSNNGENGIFLVDWYDPMRWRNGTANNILYGNHLENNLNGIHFLEADKNDIFRNTIKWNDVGIFMEDQSSHNIIYQNNFIDNVVQASNEHAGLNNWHSIYMLEGNYWSDYTGTDNDGDGIGDTPWPWWDFDAHPFMEENGWEVPTPIEEEIQNARDNPDTNRLGGGRDYRANEMGYLIVGLGQLFSERTHDTWIPPYTCQLSFYGEPYVFEGNVWYFEWLSDYGEFAWVNLFYMRIPANFFIDLGLPLGVEFNFQWTISFYSGGEQQFMTFTSYFTLL